MGQLSKVTPALSVFFLWLLQASVLLIELKLAQNSIQSAEIAYLIRTWSGPAISLLLWFGFFHSRSGLASTGGESPDKTVGQGPQTEDRPPSLSATEPLELAGQSKGRPQPQL
jgi:hypothetical protein